MALLNDNLAYFNPVSFVVPSPAYRLFANLTPMPASSLWGTSVASRPSPSPTATLSPKKAKKTTERTNLSDDELRRRILGVYLLWMSKAITPLTPPSQPMR